MTRGKAKITVDTQWLKNAFPFFNIKDYKQPVVVYANMTLYSFEKSSLIEKHLKELPENIKRFYRPFEATDNELNLLRKVYVIPLNIYLNEKENDFIAIYVDTETGEIVGGRR